MGLKEQIRAEMARAAAANGGGGRITELPDWKSESDGGNFTDDLLKGIGYSGASTITGIMDLFGLGDEYDRKAMELWKKDLDKAGVGGIIGQGVGEAAQMAIPAGALSKGLKGAKLVKSLGKAAPLVGEMGLGAGMGAIQLPSEGRSRAENALLGAGLGAGGHVAGSLLGKTLGKLSKGFSGSRSEAGKELLDAGVKLTPGQSASGIPKLVEEGLSYLPFSSKRVKSLREAGKEDWANYALNRVLDEGEDITGVGPEAMTKLKNQVKSGYEQAWKKGDTSLSETQALEILDIIDSNLPNFAPDERAVLNRVQKALLTAVEEGADEPAKLVDKVISKQLKSAKKSADLTKTLKEIKRKVRENIGDEAKQALAHMDVRYPSYLAVKDAADKAAAAASEGVFTPQNLAASIKKTSPKGAAGEGTPRLYKAMRQGVETVGQKDIGGVLERFQRLMQMVAVPGSGVTTEMLLNATVGDTALQKFIRSPQGQRIIMDMSRSVQGLNN